MIYMILCIQIQYHIRDTPTANSVLFAGAHEDHTANSLYKKSQEREREREIERDERSIVHVTSCYIYTLRYM